MYVFFGFIAFVGICFFENLEFGVIERRDGRERVWNANCLVGGW